MSARRIKKRSFKLRPGAVAALENRREAFRAKFGRDPGPDDPVFFDPNADTPVQMSGEVIEAEILAALKSANLRPELIYGYKKTGLMPPTEEAFKHWPKDRREEWLAAMEEYFQLEQRPLS